MISGGSYGVVALTEVEGAVTRISVTRSTIHRTATAALNSQTANVGEAEVNVGSSLIVDNGNAWIQQGTNATVLSLGDNQMSGNAGSVGSKAPLTPQ